MQISCKPMAEFRKKTLSTPLSNDVFETSAMPWINGQHPLDIIDKSENVKVPLDHCSALCNGENSLPPSQSTSTLDFQRRASTGVGKECIFFRLTKTMNRLYACEDYSSEECAKDFQFIGEVCRTGGIDEVISRKLCSAGIVELFRQFLRQHLEQIFNTDSSTPDSDTTAITSILYFNFLELLNSVTNLTDSSLKICRRVSDIGLYADILTALNDRCLDTGLEEFGEERRDVANGLMAILYNVVQLVPEVRASYRSKDVVEILERFRKDSDYSLSCVAVILLSYVISADESELLSSRVGTFEFLARELESALESDRNRSGVGYKACEIVSAINKLAVNEKNQEKIVQSGVVASYVVLLVRRNSREEQLGSVQGLWTLSYTCASAIRDEPGCIDGLLQLAKLSEDDEIRRRAKGALENLGENLQLTRTDRQDSCRPVATNGKVKYVESDEMVFISYNHASKPIVSDVRNRLKQAGYDVWIDEEQTCGSIAEDIMDGIDKSAVVVVCMSQKYYESPWCKKEVIYAEDHGKELIPITVEPGYTPDGWLRFHIHDRLMIDFTQENIVSSSFSTLLHRIRKVFMDGVSGVDGMRRKTSEYSLDVEKFHRTPSTLSTTTHAASKPAISGWTTSDVCQWLEKNQLAHLKDWFFDFDGSLLLECLTFKRHAPDIFATNFLLRYSFADLMKLNRVLADL